jgi:two-component system sensor kinase FixL
MEGEHEIEALRARVRELEGRLRERSSDEPFRRVVETAPYGMLVSDAEGRIVLSNPRAEEMFGYTREEFLGARIEDLLPPRYRGGHPALRRDFHADPSHRPMGSGRDLSACRRDGSEFPVEVALTPLPGEEGLLVLCSIVDITLRKRSEDELLSYSRRLERSNAELESFASIASHDLQEPLRKIRMMGERLASLCGAEIGEQGRDYLGRMIRAGDNMHRLVRDLLEFSRVGIRPEGFRPVDLAEPLRDALSALELLAEESGAEIRVGELPSAEVDEGLMRQLFQNLVGNALKFRREGVAPLVEISGSFEEGEGGSFVRIEVRDNGIGFEPRYEERIFQIFQRLHGKSEFGGTGIGLAICKKIADHHEGRIRACGSPGEGALFIVELPRRQRRSGAEPPSETK